MSQKSRDPVDSRVAGRHVLVTGASGGLGAAIARAIHAHGGRLTLSGRRAMALDTLRDELDGKPRVVAADLSDSTQLEALIAACDDVDVLVANAGLPASGRLDSFTAEQLDRAVAVNLRAPMRLAQALSKQMAARGYGHLVFISSFAGKVASGGASLYAATKFGLRGFAFALHDELRDSGVGVTTVFPAFISETGMFAETGIRLPRGVGMRPPQEVANAVIRGIETGQAEIDVAPPGLRLGAMLSGVSPSLVAALNRRLGSHEIATELADAQQHKR